MKKIFPPSTTVIESNIVDISLFRLGIPLVGVVTGTSGCAARKGLAVYLAVTT